MENSRFMPRFTEPVLATTAHWNTSPNWLKQVGSHGMGSIGLAGSSFVDSIGQLACSAFHALAALYDVGRTGCHALKHRIYPQSSTENAPAIREHLSRAWVHLRATGAHLLVVITALGLGVFAPGYLVIPAVKELGFGQEIASSNTLWNRLKVMGKNVITRRRMGYLGAGAIALIFAASAGGYTLPLIGQSAFLTAITRSIMDQAALHLSRSHSLGVVGLCAAVGIAIIARKKGRKSGSSSALESLLQESGSDKDLIIKISKLPFTISPAKPLSPAGLIEPSGHRWLLSSTSNVRSYDGAFFLRCYNTRIQFDLSEPQGIWLMNRLAQLGLSIQAPSRLQLALDSNADAGKIEEILGTLSLAKDTLRWPGKTLIFVDTEDHYWVFVPVNKGRAFELHRLVLDGADNSQNSLDDFRWQWRNTKPVLFDMAGGLQFLGRIKGKVNRRHTSLLQLLNDVTASGPNRECDTFNGEGNDNPYRDSKPNGLSLSARKWEYNPIYQAGPRARIALLVDDVGQEWSLRYSNWWRDEEAEIPNRCLALEPIDGDEDIRHFYSREEGQALLDSLPQEGTYGNAVKALKTGKRP